MTGAVHTLTEHNALVGARCVQCKRRFRVGQRVIVKPTAPARHEGCAATPA